MKHFRLSYPRPLRRWVQRESKTASVTNSATEVVSRVSTEFMNYRIEASALVEALIERLVGSYVFPDRAAKAAALIQAHLDAGGYDLPIGPELCDRLSDDLFAACEDKHLRLLWHETSMENQDEASLAAELREMFRLENQGIRRVERMPGNVGLIELTLIPEAQAVGPGITAALLLVQHTHALILDLRGARGGAPDGVAFLCSFLVGDDPVHLNDIVEGPQGPIHQYWTSAYLPGPRYATQPIYVLTSTNTFSGGEELAYDLQSLGRATVVGEATRGGAHPVTPVPLSKHVELRLPIARSVNPITGSNWEGVGVQPDRLIAANEAFTAAYRAALATIADDAHTPDTSRTEARRLLETAQA